MADETEKLLSSVERSSPLAAVSTEPAPTAGEETSFADKINEEASAAAEQQEEKLVEAVENAEEKTVVENRELIPPIDEVPAAVPFVEESYYVKDLKESERKALQEFREKIAEGINNNTLLVPPSRTDTAGSIRDINVEKAEERGQKDDGPAEEKSPAEEEKESKTEDDEKKKGILMGEDTVLMEEEEQKKAGMNVEETEGKELKAEEHLPSMGKDDSSMTTSSTAMEASQVTATDTPIANDAEAAPSSVPELAPPVEEAATVPGAEVEMTTMPRATETEQIASQGRVIDIESQEESLSLEDLSVWGVPLLYSKGDERTDVVLLKFLRARDFKVNDAMSMLKETVLWRKDFEADGLIDEEITTEFDSVAYMFGVDKEGHPVCYNHYGVFQDKELYQKTFGDEAQFKKFLRWRIQVVEKGMQKLDFRPSGLHSMVQVTDLKESPGFVKRRNITKKAVTILQDNYPELVAKQIFVNVPWYFGALYALHGKFVTARSKSKVVIVRPEKVTETLLKYIAVDNLPVRYGGLGRINDRDFEGVEAQVQEVVIKPGEKQTIELPEQEVGSTAVWDVVVVGWEVVYGEEFVPSGEGKYTVIIQKPKRMTAAEEPLRNSFKATADAGKVVITIENTSRKKKLTEYRHKIKQQAISES